MNEVERLRVQAKLHAYDALVHAKAAQHHAAKAVHWANRSSRWLAWGFGLQMVVVALLLLKAVGP